jgi:endonuclease/exonuclease/phosphatase family metal-dependent hydrolase
MRLVTWNTLWRFGNWEPRQPLLARTLRGTAPDVVLLQETWPDQAEVLAEQCGLQLLGFSGGYFDQDLSSVPVDAEFGNAILARSGEIEIDESFPAPGDPAPRRLLVAAIEGRRFATSHLTHMPHAGEQRARQLEWIVGRLRGSGGAADRDATFVFGGDCNLVPSSNEYRVAPELGLRDLWAEHHPADHGPTMLPANPEIAQVGWMDERNDVTVPPGTGVRLDYLWASGAVGCSSIERFGVGDGKRWPSDHLGLVAELD